MLRLTRPGHVPGAAKPYRLVRWILDILTCCHSTCLENLGAQHSVRILGLGGRVENLRGKADWGLRHCKRRSVKERIAEWRQSQRQLHWHLTFIWGFLTYLSKRRPSVWIAKCRMDNKYAENTVNSPEGFAKLAFPHFSARFQWQSKSQRLCTLSYASSFFRAVISNFKSSFKSFQIYQVMQSGSQDLLWKWSPAYIVNQESFVIELETGRGLSSICLWF